MNIIEEKSSIMFKYIEKDTTKEVIDQYDFRVIDGKLLIGKVDGKNDLIEKWNQINNIADTDGAILLTRSFNIEVKDDEITYERVNSLFMPQFECKEFSLSKIEFYIKKTYLFSVTFEYDYGSNINIKIGKFISNENEIELTFIEGDQILEDITERFKETL